MSEQRKAIRNKVVSLLRQGVSLAGSRVVAGQSTPTQADKLPALCVYYGQETAEQATAAPRELLRTLRLVIEVFVDGTSETEAIDNLDAISEQIERVLFDDDTLGGVAEDFVFSGSQCAFSSEGEKPMASQSFTFDAQYLTSIPKEYDALDDLNTVGAEWTPNDGDPANDEIDLT